MQKWSQENPELLAQAGLAAAVGTNNTHLGKLTDAQKEHLKKLDDSPHEHKIFTTRRDKKSHGSHATVRVINGQRYIVMPSAPISHPILNHGTQLIKVENEKKKNHTLKNKYKKMDAENLKHNLESESKIYLDTINNSKELLKSSFEKIETGIKGHAIRALQAVYDFSENSDSKQQAQKLAEAYKNVNEHLFKYAKSNVEYSPIKVKAGQNSINACPPIEIELATRAPNNLRKTWVVGYLIKEVIKIVYGHLRTNTAFKELKIKPYFNQIKAVAAELHTTREKITYLIKLLNHTATAATNQQRVNLVQHSKTFECEFDEKGEMHTISMSSPYGY